MIRHYPEIGVSIPSFFIPKSSINFSKWAVIACDQFTSEPEYWQSVEKYIGDSPSTYHLFLPEAYLGTEREKTHLSQTTLMMKEYISNNYFNPLEGMVYIERTVGDKMRKGLLLALDLEKYDYHVGSSSLIRASEKTIIERLPPRIEIRKKAILELPHILVLIDDRQNEIIEPLEIEKHKLALIYDFKLMANSGHLSGYLIKNRESEHQIISGFRALINPQLFAEKYHVSMNTPLLLFAVGDGNHSLATAKAFWEELKKTANQDHPAKNALVEIVNIHDSGLDFKPIHRLLFDSKTDIFDIIKTQLNVINVTPVSDDNEWINTISSYRGDNHIFGCIDATKKMIFEIEDKKNTLCVGRLQPFFDEILKNQLAASIDYIHGNHTLIQLATNDNNVGFLLPPVSKEDLFTTIIKEGVLPRKTFSMGEAHEKRFYFECRKIQ